MSDSFDPPQPCISTTRGRFALCPVGSARLLSSTALPSELGRLPVQSVIPGSVSGSQLSPSGPVNLAALAALGKASASAAIAPASRALWTVRAHTARAIIACLRLQMSRSPGASAPGCSGGPSRAAAQEIALAEQLGELHRVGGGALSEVVAHDPQVQAALVRGVAADAAHQHLVAAGGVDGLRIDAVGGVVEHDDAREAAQQLAALIR